MPITRKSTDKKAIRKLDVAWGNSASKGDLNAVVAFYARAGSVVWPGVPAAHGTARIRSAWKKVFAQYRGLTLKFTPERIDVASSADMAADFGKVSFGCDTSKGRVMNTGKYVVVWKKVNGAWKVFYDSYNMNKP